MSTKQVGILAAVAVALVLLMLALETQDTGTARSERLLPGLEAAANELREVRITAAKRIVTLRRDGGGKGDGDDDGNGNSDGDGWLVAERDGYPADLGRLRQLVRALAEARIVERKTADPANYDRLGVGDPAAGGDGSKVVLAGGGNEFAVILGDPEGDPARADFRYARVAGEAQSALIDRNPELPAGPAGWLDDALADIPASRVRRVRVSHADGETIVIEREGVEKEDAAEDGTGSEVPGDFAVLDVPEGRELKYDTIANGIGAALAGLDAEDVRRAPAEPGEAVTVTVFETVDGETVTVRVYEQAGSGDGTEGGTGDGDGTTAWIAIAAEPDVDGLNERAAGWQYRLPSFKLSPLTRRWEDLLKEP